MSEEKQPDKNVGIEILDLTPSRIVALHRSGINTVADLLTAKAVKIRTIKYIGESAYQKIRFVLIDKGYVTEEEWDESDPQYVTCSKCKGVGKHRPRYWEKHFQ